jgi:hypothetical protein
MTHSNRRRDADRPLRIAARPDPAAWDDDELMTLREAAFLMWPAGPLTERSLRTAAESGLLPVTMIARKRLTTRRALREMSRCAPAPIVRATAASGPAPGRPPADATTPTGG